MQLVAHQLISWYTNILLDTYLNAIPKTIYTRPTQQITQQTHPSVVRLSLQRHKI